MNLNFTKIILITKNKPHEPHKNNKIITNFYSRLDSLYNIKMEYETKSKNVIKN